MKKDKPTFVFIIILCLISIPLAVYGTIIRKTTNKQTATQNDGDFYYKGTLNFYENNNLLGTYTCTIASEDKCGYATSYNDPEDNNVDTYKNGNVKNYEILDSQYALIKDGDYNYLLAIKNHLKMATFNNVKFYNTKLKNNYVLVEDTKGKWGIMSLNPVNLILNYSYDYLGLINDYDTSLNTDYLIAKINGTYSIINSTGSNISTSFSNPIYSYSINSKVLAIKNGNGYSLYTFEGNTYLSGTYPNVALSKNYVLTIDSNKNLNIYKGGSTTAIYNTPLSTYQTIDLKEATTGVDILIDGQVFKTIANS